MNSVFTTLEEANRQWAIKESFIYKVIKRYSFKEICENILWAFRWFKNSPGLASLKHLPDYFVCYFLGGRQRITGLGWMKQAKQPKIPLSPPLRKGVDAGQFLASVGDGLWLPLTDLVLCESWQENPP